MARPMRTLTSSFLFLFVVAFILVGSHASTNTNNLPSNDDGGAATSASTTTTTTKEQHNINHNNKKRIAIIGGGIGGTFAARYLAQYDSSACLIDSITVFDPTSELSSDGSNKAHDDSLPRSESADLETSSSAKLLSIQGPRVSSIKLPNGNVAELGASIVYSGNKLVTDMIDSGKLIKTDPDHYDDPHSDTMPSGMGIYDGHGKWDILSTNIPSSLFKLKLLYRYNIDLYKIRSKVLDAIHSFINIYDMLDSTTDEKTFFNSPDEMWNAVKLLDLTTMSFDEYLDQIGVTRSEEEDKVEFSWLNVMLNPVIRTMFLPKKGLLRKEILTGVSLCNYNQYNSRLNGLAGLVSFLPTQGSVYKVQGGNTQILTSAFHQAKDNHAKTCGGTDANGVDKVRHVPKIVTSVISHEDASGGGGMELMSNDDDDGETTTSLGTYDVVILAAPLQQCQISFLTQRHRGGGNDVEAMPLNGVVVDTKTSDSSSSFLGPLLPSSTKRQYTQTVTTLITNGTLQHDHYFGLSKSSSIPQSLTVTQKGKEETGFQSISQLTSDGTFKMFSSKPFTTQELTDIFGPYHSVVQVKIWGGTYGGAYPDFDGGGYEISKSAPFLLYDSSSSSSSALYYVNAVEASMSAMEISAIGAKAVSKLVARRLGLIADVVGGEGGGVGVTTTTATE